jgi:hypothetical protein
MLPGQFQGTEDRRRAGPYKYDIITSQYCHPFHAMPENKKSSFLTTDDYPL